jgi:predicted nucleic-acid-binding protein
MAGSIAIDASVLVRYLTGDVQTLATAATNLFRAAQSGKVRLVIPTSTIQETVHVLEWFYHLDSTVIAPKLISVLTLPNVDTPDARWVMEALQFYRFKNCDFGDALLCAFARSKGLDVATFDKDLIKTFPEVPAYTPVDWVAGKTRSGRG